MTTLDFTQDQSNTALGWSEEEVPDVPAFGAAWWRERVVRIRFANIVNLTAAAFPNIFTGYVREVTVSCACADGAALARANAATREAALDLATKVAARRNDS